MSLKGYSNCQYVAWEQLNTVLASFTPAKCSVKYTSLLPLLHVKHLQMHIKAQHSHVPAALCCKMWRREQRQFPMFRKSYIFWYLALLSQCSLHWCSSVISKGDTLYMHSTIQNCSQSDLVILQMHRFETSDDDKNNLISCSTAENQESPCHSWIG